MCSLTQTISSPITACSASPCHTISKPITIQLRQTFHHNYHYSSDITSLWLLFDNLAYLLEALSTSEFDFYTVAKIVLADGKELVVHRCILAERGYFFRSSFAGCAAAKEEKRVVAGRGCC